MGVQHVGRRVMLGRSMLFKMIAGASGTPADLISQHSQTEDKRMTPVTLQQNADGSYTLTVTDGDYTFTIKSVALTVLPYVAPAAIPTP